MRIPPAVLVAISVACLTIGCGAGLGHNSDRLAGNEPPHHLRKASFPVPADNAAVQARDAKSGDPATMDHSEAPVDRDLTRRVRQAVMADGSLSLIAYNVKILSSKGRVTLRGPVATQSERLSIQEKATGIAGANNVDDQLVVRR
jgi:hypothetical protein